MSRLQTTRLWALLLLLLPACIGVDLLDDTITSNNDSGQVEITGLSSNDVFVNQSIQLNAAIINANADVDSSDLTWSSTNPRVAIVDGNGLVSTLSVGQTQIIASFSQNSADTLLLNVINNPDAVTSIEIVLPAGQDQVSFKVGDTLSLMADLRNADGDLINAEELTWSSDDTLVVKVNQQGQAFGIMAGQAHITAEYMGIMSDPILFSVVTQSADLASIQIQASRNQTSIGDSLQFTATGLDGEGNEIENLVFSWESEDPSILEIDETGQAIGIGGGRTNISASVDGFSSLPFAVTVIDPNQVTSLTISAPGNNLMVGETITLSFQARNALNQNVEAESINWASSNPNLLSIDANGQATALGVGTVQVTASVGDVSSNTLVIGISENTTTTSRSGSFQGLNNYNVQGTATLRFDESKNHLVVEFGSDFTSQNGPGLYIYLSNQSGNVNGGVELGTIKSNRGVQSYDVPSEVEINDFNFVVVFCKPFRAPFGSAQLD